MYSIIIFSILAVHIIFAQVDEHFKGNCPNVTTKANFSENQYGGKWYEVKHFTNTLITGECGLPTYTNTDNGFNVSYSYRNMAENKNYVRIIELKKRKIGANLTGKYDVVVDGKMQDIPHFILDTDYKTYSVVWGCTLNATNNTNTQRLSIYSRKSMLDAATITKATELLKNLTIDYTKLKNVEQNDKKCGRNSGTTVILNLIVSAFFVILLSKCN